MHCPIIGPKKYWSYRMCASYTPWNLHFYTCQSLKLFYFYVWKLVVFSLVYMTQICLTIVFSYYVFRLVLTSLFMKEKVSLLLEKCILPLLWRWNKFLLTALYICMALKLKPTLNQILEKKGFSKFWWEKKTFCKCLDSGHSKYKSSTWKCWG